jgi:hypothetical protein
MCSRVRFPARSPERARHEAMRVKPLLQWRPQNVADARSTKPLEESHRQQVEPDQERGHVNCRSTAAYIMTTGLRYQMWRCRM